METDKDVYWHLVPTFRPEVDGLGDWAAVVTDEASKSGFSSRIMVARQTWKGTDERVVALTSRRRLGEQLLTLGVRKLIVHYVGYGYAKRGCPSWLVAELRRWKASSKESVHLSIFMHELFVSRSRPWKSAFWLAPLQRRIARHLIRMADQVLTSNAIYATWIEGQNPNTSVSIFPVISNIGEPQQLPEWETRARRLAIFGKQTTRRQAFDNVLPHIERIKKELKVTEIVEMGPGSSVEPSPPMPGIEWTALGLLSAERVSAVLLSSRYGAIDTSQGPLPKSGVLAAYASHGVVPVIFGADTVWSEFPKTLAALAGRESNLKSRQLANWYGDHSVSRIVAFLYA